MMIIIITLSELRKLGFVFHSDPSLSINNDGGFLPFQNSGLITFSRFPIQKCSFAKFQSTSERLNNKGFEISELVLGAGDSRSIVVCVNTHLDSRPRAQPQQVKQITAACVPFTTPFFAGNFCLFFNIVILTILKSW